MTAAVNASENRHGSVRPALTCLNLYYMTILEMPSKCGEESEASIVYDHQNLGRCVRRLHLSRIICDRDYSQFVHNLW